MIPKFPEFKKLELSDEEKIGKITKKFPPYSDFNFVSMWSWNIANKIRISQLHGNLVVHFTDYLIDETFFSFIGENKISETATELITFSKKHYNVNSLKLIPEEIANSLDKSKFTILSDVNSHDYIYSIPHLASMNVWPQSSLSKGIRRFIKKYSDYVIKQYLIKEISKDKYEEMFQKWAKNKKIKNHLELNEYKALKKLLQIDSKNIKIVSIYLNNILIGFTAHEILANNYAMSHFAKADVSHHSSVYDVLNWEEAKILKNQEIKYYNWEQDLGIQGLRNSKQKYKPSFLLKKFTITRITDH